MLLTVLVYHLAVSGRVRWLSPGELMTGRCVQDGKKQWANPYDRNRWALFLIQMITLVVAGNSWDGIGDGVIYPLRTAVSRSIFLGLLVYGIVKVGQGALSWVGMIAFYFVIMAVRSMVTALPADIPEAIRGLMALGFMGLAAFAVAVGLAYERPPAARFRGGTKWQVR